ncbi:MAG: polyprenyl synthetase family protein [Chloroflexi bacterium]|nr:polyprenyl synthetase family protein [Chloroflexota bacterium]
MTGGYALETAAGVDGTLGGDAMSSLERARSRWTGRIEAGMRDVVARHAPDARIARVAEPTADLSPGAPSHYGMMRYHLGWVDEAFELAQSPTGKRLRPLLAILGAEACGADGSRALPIAVALELLHNFTLIHDDIEDGDTHRHHRPTVWKVWGEAQGINAGDGMHVLSTLALLELVDSGVSPALVTNLASRFARTSLIVTEGQHLDLEFVGLADVTPEAYLDMIARKSAALISCAMAMGAQVADASSETVAAMADFGFALGLGFQVRDDILGIWGDAARTGKPTSDLARRKKTLPTLVALSGLEGADRLSIATLLASPDPSPKMVDKARDAIDRSGARQHCELLVAKYSENARRHLAVLPDGEARNALGDLVTYLASRDA